jgi:poly-gamma-glutamate synthesis protein (capsule biosynthesis protein)
VSASRAEKVRYTPAAKENSAGIFLMYDDERLLQVIEEADKQCDYLIAYLHWGTEDSKYYEEYQHNIAVELIDKGVDAIIGGHPHVLQGFEYINGKPVIYSLGDFWFNGETKYNGMVRLEIGINGLISASYIPCMQTNYTTVYVKDENTRNEICEYLNELSSGCKINNIDNLEGEIVPD